MEMAVIAADQQWSMTRVAVSMPALYHCDWHTCLWGQGAHLLHLQRPSQQPVWQLKGVGLVQPRQRNDGLLNYAHTCKRILVSCLWLACKHKQDDVSWIFC